jgi:methionyl-tRNA formyltransferase
MKIIFFGSGPFAYPIVNKIGKEFTLSGVVVIKPRPRGRGLKTVLPEVVHWANDIGIEVFTPANPNDASFINTVAKLKPDLFVLASYGHILSRKLLDIPKFGGINIHPSLLPRYRGAAPIQRVIMAGEEKTGVTVIFMDEKIDHGEIIFQKELDIMPNENYNSLLSRLASLGADIIIDVLKSCAAGTYRKIVQNEKEKIYAPKIRKGEMVINWCESSKKIVNLIRALSPKPGARTKFRKREIKIISAIPADKKLKPGTFHINKKQLLIGTGDGAIILKEMKPENRSVISGLDFINGFRVKEGEVAG